jgi:hypothetical protein
MNKVTHGKEKKGKRAKQKEILEKRNKGTHGKPRRGKVA